jgi:hypothetical protein
VKSVGTNAVLQQSAPRAHAAAACARVASFSALGGTLREFGIDVSVGTVRGIATIREALRCRSFDLV